MKILIVDHCLDLMGGVERTLCSLANRLAVNNEVIVLSEERIGKKSFFEWDSRIKRDYLTADSDYFLFGQKTIIRKLKNVLGNKLGKTSMKRKIRDYLMECSDVDVIIFGRVFVALRFLPVIKSVGAKPKIIVRDAIHLDLFSRSVKRKLKRFFPEIVDTFIVSSDESLRAYEDFFETNTVNLVKLYNPLGIIPRVGYDNGAKTVISIGRMDDDQKGFSCLIRSFVHVHKKHNDWKLNIYGDGAMRGSFQKIIRQVNAEGYITILPPSKDVVSLFNQSSMFVLASRFEGYANALVEALSCGVPSITFDWLMGADEIIENGINGSIVNLTDRKSYFKGTNNESDQECLANEICRLIEDPLEAKKYSRNAADIIKSRDPEVILEKWLRIINGNSV